MAITSFPFDNADTTESQYSRLFRELQDDGVAADYSSAAFKVTADGSGMDVQVGPGFAIVRGHAVQSTTTESLVIPTASSQPRIDRIVLRLDPTANTISIAHVQGTASSSPLPPGAMMTDSGVYEMVLADIYIAANVLNIAQSAITDKRPFAGHRAGVWATATRPEAPRLGRFGYNVQTSVWEFWDGAAWQSISNPVKTIRMTKTFTISGEVKVANGDENFIPPFFVSSPVGQVVKVVALRSDLNTGGTATVELRRNGTLVPGFSTTVTTSDETLNPADVTLNDLDKVALVVTSVSGGPKNMTVDVLLDVVV